MFFLDSPKIVNIEFFGGSGQRMCCPEPPMDYASENPCSNQSEDYG